MAGNIPPRRTRTRSGRGRARSVLPRWNCCGPLAPTLSSLWYRSSPAQERWHVELAKMMGDCYLCGTSGMLLAVSIAFSDRTESQ